MHNRQANFANYGGSVQLELQSAADLPDLAALDDPFWMATSAPVSQLRCPRPLLELLDADGDGRILSGDLRRVCAWLLQVLRDPTELDKGEATLSLNAINEDEVEGKRLAAAARRILDNLGKPDATELTLDEVRRNRDFLKDGGRNGDGVIPPESVEDPDLREFVLEILETVGGVADMAGRTGVSSDELKIFVSHTQELLRWQDDDRIGDCFPFGDETASLWELTEALREPMEAFFLRCRVMATNRLLDRTEEQTVCPAESQEGVASMATYLRSCPLAKPNADGLLRLSETAPVWTEKISQLATTLGSKTSPANAIDETAWLNFADRFSTFAAWREAMKASRVECLGPDRLRKRIEQNAPAKLQVLIDTDLAVGRELSATKELEQVLLANEWIIRFCNNFISFPHLYDPSERAMFEIGCHVIDGKIFNFNLRVDDVKAHSKAAAHSGMYLAYSEVSGKNRTPFFMVTPVTSRRLGNVGVGKRGVLFDRDGSQWDTRILKVVENPASLFEALGAPFRKLVTVLVGAVDKVSTHTEKELAGQLNKKSAEIQKGVAAGITAPPPPKKPAPAPPPPKATADAAANGRAAMMTGGVALAALSSSFAFVTETFTKIGPTNALAGIAVGIVLLVVPVLLVALYRLHNRNLSTVLEASGWAINARMRLTHRLGSLLAPVPQHPASFTTRQKDRLRDMSGTLKQQMRGTTVGLFHSISEEKDSEEPSSKEL